MKATVQTQQETRRQELKAFTGAHVSVGVRVHAEVIWPNTLRYTSAQNVKSDHISLVPIISNMYRRV